MCHFSKFLCGDKVEQDDLRKKAYRSNIMQSLVLLIFMSIVKAGEEEKNYLSILSHTKTEQPDIRYKGLQSFFRTLSQGQDTSLIFML